jgi:hypothetical protein
VDKLAVLNHTPAGEHSSFGVRPFEFTYLTAGLLASALLVFIVVSHLTGDWHASHLYATFPARGAAPSLRWCTCSS